MARRGGRLSAGLAAYRPGHGRGVLGAGAVMAGVLAAWGVGDCPRDGRHIAHGMGCGARWRGGVGDCLRGWRHIAHGTGVVAGDAAGWAIVRGIGGISPTARDRASRGGWRRRRWAIVCGIGGISPTARAWRGGGRRAGWGGRLSAGMAALRARHGVWGPVARRGGRLSAGLAAYRARHGRGGWWRGGVGDCPRDWRHIAHGTGVGSWARGTVMPAVARRVGSKRLSVGFAAYRPPTRAQARARRGAAGRGAAGRGGAAVRRRSERCAHAVRRPRRGGGRQRRRRTGPPRPLATPADQRLPARPGPRACPTPGGTGGR